MNCPQCNVSLSVSERQGVEIDYCPQCRGVWLDRGELDKILERASRFEDRDDDRPDSRPDARYDDHGRPRHPGEYKQHYEHRRKSWWQELFD